MASLKPTAKVQSGINWSAFATIVVATISVFFPEQYSRLPAGFELALGMFLGSAVASIAAWCKRDRSTDIY